MSDHDDVAQRAYHQPDPHRVEVRELTEDEEGMFAIRMPISSTVEARDGEAFDVDRLRGWAEQINEGTVGVFLDHGRNNDLSMSRYSGTGKLGYYADAEVVDRDDGESDLMADTRLMDPESLPTSTGTLREHLARIKSMAERNVPIAQSVGWSDDVGDRDLPGGSDLLEGSIVGIPSDPEASSHGAAVEMARAAMAVDDDRDPEQLVADFRAVVMGSDTGTEPLQQRHLSEQQADLALDVLDEFRNSQGDGSVGNFEDWLWSRGHEFDEDTIHAARTSLQEFYRDTTPLEDPVSNQFVGYLEERSDDTDAAGDDGGEGENMADNDDTDSAGDGDGNRDDQDGMDAEEYRESMLEMQRQQTETLSTLADALREDGEDGDDSEDDDEDEDEDDESDDRTVTVDGEEMTADEAVRQLRDDVDGAEPDVSDSASDGEDGGERDEEHDDQPADPRNLL